MKKRQVSFNSVLVAVLVLGSAPAWACVRACGVGGQGLECLKLCNRSRALLTEGGNLPSMGAEACGLDQAVQPVLASVSPYQLEAPVSAAWAMDALPQGPVRVDLALIPSQRGPPLPITPLLARLPRAHAPPFFG